MIGLNFKGAKLYVIQAKKPIFCSKLFQVKKSFRSWKLFYQAMA